MSRPARQGERLPLRPAVPADRALARDHSGASFCPGACDGRDRSWRGRADPGRPIAAAVRAERAARRSPGGRRPDGMGTRPRRAQGAVRPDHRQAQHRRRLHRDRARALRARGPGSRWVAGRGTRGCRARRRARSGHALAGPPRMEPRHRPGARCGVSARGCHSGPGTHGSQHRALLRVARGRPGGTGRQGSSRACDGNGPRAGRELPRVPVAARAACRRRRGRGLVGSHPDGLRRLWGS